MSRLHLRKFREDGSNGDSMATSLPRVARGCAYTNECVAAGEQDGNHTKSFVAAAHIPAGTVLFREIPLATFDFQADKETSFAAHVAKASSSLVSCLPAGATDPTSDSTVAGRTLASTCSVFGGEDGSSSMTGALLPTLSRIRHSDSPNTTLSLPWALRVNDRIILSVIALNDIAQGQEITMCHVSRLQDPDARQSRLQWQFGPSATPEAAPIASSLSLIMAEPGPDDGVSDGAVMGSAAVTASNAAEALEGATCFLSSALPLLHATHWRVLRARRTAIVALMYLRKWAEAWLLLKTQAVAVFNILGPAEAEAQYHTHGLGEHILRSWQALDPAAAAAASLGGMLRFSAAGYAQAKPGASRSASPVHEDSWLREMLWGAQVLRPAVSDGFYTGPPLS